MQLDVGAVAEVPAWQIIKLTERAKAMLEDSLPEGPGVLESDDEDVHAASPEVESPWAPSLLHIHFCWLFKTMANKFNLV